MDGSGWMSAKELVEDNEWTFGQLLSVFLLGAAPLSLLNAWSGYHQRDKDGHKGGKDPDTFLLNPLYYDNRGGYARV